MTQTARANSTCRCLTLRASTSREPHGLTYLLRQRFRYDYEGRTYALHHHPRVIPRPRRGTLRLRVQQVEVSAADATKLFRRHGVRDLLFRQRCSSGSSGADGAFPGQRR